MSEEGEVDPRVKTELDSLNQATDEINRLETELSAERCRFTKLRSEAKEMLQDLTKNKEKSIAKARPYYEAIKQAKQADESLQLAVDQYHRANGVHRAAKETIRLMEQSLQEMGGNQGVDQAWQESIRRNVMRLQEAEQERTRSEEFHRQAARRRELLSRRASTMRKKHRRSVEKSSVYFDERERVELILQQQSGKVEILQKKVEAAKLRYKTSLKNLEVISSEIHQRRVLEESIRKMSMMRKRSEIQSSSSSSDDLDFDTHRHYGMKELQDDIENFDFSENGEYEISGDEYSDTGSEVSSTTSSRKNSQRKRRSLKNKNRISVKRRTSEAIMEEEENQKSSVKSPHEARSSARKSSSPHNHDDVTMSLHGVHVTSHNGEAGRRGNQDSEEEIADDFDIFDELC